MHTHIHTDIEEERKSKGGSGCGLQAVDALSKKDEKRLAVKTEENRLLRLHQALSLARARARALPLSRSLSLSFRV